MNSYYTILNVLLLVSIGILLRYGGYRLRYFLHMFQLFGYKSHEFLEWASRHFFSRVITPEHVMINVVLVALLYLMSERMTVTAAAIVLSVFVFFWFGSVSRFSPEKEKKPLRFTPRMIRLTIAQTVLILLPLIVILDLAFTGRLLNSTISIREFGLPVLMADPYFLFFGMVLVDLMSPLLLLISAGLMKPVEKRIHEGFKKKARSKLAKLQDLKIVAVTGSYGKTSTKFMIHDLLNERYKVCVTPGSYNTPMGICKVINDDLEAHHQVLVLEMGARYPGNIRELCEIARPDVAVITNVGKAHLETFGSIDSIAREKSTLARELNPGGALILNSDDERVRQMADLREDVQVIQTGLNTGSIRARNVEIGEQGTRFIMLWESEPTSRPAEQEIQMKLLGAHNVQNFLLAAGVAHTFGIRPATLALAAKKIEPVRHRLELKKEGDLYVIDDAFNSNPVGARNAVDILCSFKSGRHIMITPGMVELGEAQEEENRNFGRYLAEAGLDLVILVGPEQTKPILEGIRESGRINDNIRVVKSLFEANDLVRDYARSGDIILYENDLPDTYDEP
ncbi:MAG: UDP-N-acetylmuramoyl-tripeptide--D-alanyl-D-alanine ligase [Balneolaceae bacterium]